MKYLEDFKKGNYDEFVQEMKKNLQEEASRNKVLDIKGLNKSKEERGGEQK